MATQKVKVPAAWKAKPVTQRGGGRGPVRNPGRPYENPPVKRTESPARWDAKTNLDKLKEAAGTKPTRPAPRPGAKPTGSIGARPMGTADVGQKGPVGSLGQRTGMSVKPTVKPTAPTVKPPNPAGSKVAKGLRGLAGTKARAIGAGVGIAGSALSGDVKGAAITGGTYAAGKGLQALPHPAAKLAGKALEFAAPFAPGIAGALSSGSAKARPGRTSSGAKTKADLIGGNTPKKSSSFNEKAYASQQKFSTPKPADSKKSAPVKPAATNSNPPAAPNRAPAAAARTSAPVRRPSPAPAVSKQTGDKAKDMETWRKANPTLAKALDERQAKKQSGSALKISNQFDTKSDVYSPSTKVDGSKLDTSKIDQKKVSEYNRRKGRYYS
jgi:hypothetical protein